MPNSSISKFKLLDSFLCQHKEYWQFLPFDCLALPWQKQQPELCLWLSELSLSALMQYKAEPILLAQALAKWLPEVKGYAKLCDIPKAKKKLKEYDFRLAQAVPGRKWQQIQDFHSAIFTSEHKAQSVLEWCSGKGYLGRAIAATSSSRITSLEWQPSLCESGQAYADKHGLNMRFIQADAFSPSSLALVKEHQQAVALHACGSLHIELIKAAAKTQLSTLALSPCCYHLIKEKYYQPLSTLAKDSKLKLSRQCLKLPLQETVTAGKRIQNLRAIEVSFRLGFDSLQRDIFGHSHYLPLPNIQKSLLKNSFAEFCFWAAIEKKINLPNKINFDFYLEQGKKRFLLVEQIETVRTLFKRPMELWLAFDKVLFMQEHQFNVELSCFCERQLTPRNLLILCDKISRE